MRGVGVPAPAGLPAAVQLREELSMNMMELREKAKPLGVKPARMKKIELVRAIQVAEGNRPCYGTQEGRCTNGYCCFWADCRKIKG
jgi:hypothetical protein